MKVFGNLDLQVNQILKHRLEQLTTDPVSDLVSGRVWYNTTSNQIKYYDGTTVKVISDNSDIQNLETLLNNLQSELDATQVGAGLGTDGSYTANASANYIATATSLSDADNLLDAQVKTNADGLASEITNRTNADATIQAELDATQAGAGLGTDGSYVANASANYIASATSLSDADNLLDTQIKTVATTLSQFNLQTAYDQSVSDASGSASINLATGKDFRIYDDTDTNVYFQIDSETGAVTITGDLIVSGTTTTVNSTITDADHWLISPTAGTTSAIVVNPDTGVTFVTDVVDIKISNNGPSVFRISSSGVVEFDTANIKNKFTAENQSVVNQTISTTGNVNLGHTDIVSGSFTTTAAVGGVPAVQGTDYTLDYKTGILSIINNFDSGATVSYSYHPTFDGRNLKEDGQKLDDHINNSVSGIKHTGSMISYDNTTSGLTSTDVQAAIDELKTLSGSSQTDISDLQAELDATQVGAGLGTDGSYSANTSANYIATATSLANADSLLDAQVKTNADGLAAEITNRTDADTEIRNDFGSVTANKGASLVGVNGSFTNATGTNVQSILSGFDTAITNAGKRYLAENVSPVYNSSTNLYEATIVHNLGHKYVNTTVFENDEVIIPHSVIAVDSNTTKINFTTNVVTTIKIIG